MVSNYLTGNPQMMNEYNQMMSLTDEQKAQKIADACNKNGVTKEQLAQILKGMNV